MTGANEKRSRRERKEFRNADISVLSGKRVLFCEDHPLNRELIQHILVEKGMHVESAENGKAGLQLFEQSPTGYYDIILMDMQMPVMDGLEATRQIRSLPRKDAGTITIIAITAEISPQTLKHMKAAGMAEAILKPAAPQKLYETLAYYIVKTAKEC